MTSVIDPDELLRSANPVDEARLLAPSESVAAQRLFEKITGVSYQPRPRLPHRRRWRVYVTSVAALVAVGGGVAFAVTYRQPTRRLNVECFAQPSLTGRALAMLSNGRDPVAVCRDAWRAKRVVRGRDNPPDLVACVIKSGVAGVFPTAGGENVCRRLGLTAIATTPPQVPTSIPAVVGLRDRVVADLQGSCLGGPQAQAIVQAELRRAGLTDWTVTIMSPVGADRPCASPGFDEPGRRVLIIPSTTPSSP
jgi:hypothetical protein